MLGLAHLVVAGKDTVTKITRSSEYCLVLTIKYSVSRRIEYINVPSRDLQD